MSKLRFSYRMVSLPSHGIKNMAMRGTEELVFYASPGGANYALNRNFYNIVSLPSEKLICRAMTLKKVREIIERLHFMNFDWSEALLEGSAESKRLSGAISLMWEEGLVY